MLTTLSMKHLSTGTLCLFLIFYAEHPLPPPPPSASPSPSIRSPLPLHPLPPLPPSAPPLYNLLTVFSCKQKLFLLFSLWNTHQFSKTGVLLEKGDPILILITCYMYWKPLKNRKIMTRPEALITSKGNGDNSFKLMNGCLILGFKSNPGLP